MQEALASSNRQLSVVAAPKKHKGNALIQKLDEIKQTIDSKPVLDSIRLDELNNLVATIQEKGNRKVITYKGRPPCNW